MTSVVSRNLILNVDSYKTSHYAQYPPDTAFLSSYIESRGGKYSEVLFFGLQAFIRSYLQTPISAQDIDEAEVFLRGHGLPFHRAGWEHILQKHKGYLPLAIDAVKEGMIVPSHQVLLQISNIDPACYWLSSYLETSLLRAIWYPTTVATTSLVCKKIIYHYLIKTADSADSLCFKLHDFGARGVSSFESASLGGLAHLVNFTGTDTISGVLAARAFYHEEMAGFSLPAAEHSTIVSWGRDREEDAYRKILQTFCGEGKQVAVVSDSYDLYGTLQHLWGDTLQQEIVQQGGTVIIRLDSGDPVEIVIAALKLLKEKFGAHLNSKGYFQLPPYLRIIQGDGISPSMIEAILFAMEQHRFSADNIAFGMGGELLQKINRDTLRFAMKVSAIQKNGSEIWEPVFKDPATDPNKRSKPGRLALIQEEGEFQTIQAEDLAGRQNLLEPVYAGGQLLREQSLAEIRKLSWSLSSSDR